MIIKAILFFSWSVKSISSKSGIDVISSFVISIFKKFGLSIIGGGIVVVVVVVVVVVMQVNKYVEKLVNFILIRKVFKLKSLKTILQTSLIKHWFCI